MIQINEIILGDCMDIMPLIPELNRDVLAIVDPPYGIGETWKKNREGKNKDTKSYKNNSIPDSSYFKELFRISYDWIIWGSNYFTKYLPPSNKLICWDKICNCITELKSEFEIAQTSITKYPARFYRQQWSGWKKGEETGIKTIHPHQKPVMLYRWLLQKYAKPGDIILDTHSGSGSLACACHLEKFDFIAIEKDVDYHRDSVKRLDELRAQGVLF